MGVDILSQASDGAVTELEIATNGAIEGDAVGENVWTWQNLTLQGQH